MSLVGKIALFTIAVASFSVWITGWVLASSNTRVDLRTGLERDDGPDLFDDSTTSIQAEGICAIALSRIDELPISSEATSPQNRAVAITAATETYQIMLDALMQLDTSTERDRLILDGWLTDWGQVISDRITFTAGLSEGRDEPFTITDRGGTERIDRRITRLTITNEMLSCQFPMDLGG